MRDEPLKPSEPLAPLPPRSREMLRRLAQVEHRTEEQEILWLIEARLLGRLLYTEIGTLTPKAPLEDLPGPLIERAAVIQKDF